MSAIFCAALVDFVQNFDFDFDKSFLLSISSVHFFILYPLAIIFSQYFPANHRRAAVAAAVNSLAANAYPTFVRSNILLHLFHCQLIHVFCGLMASNLRA